MGKFLCIFVAALIFLAGCVGHRPDTRGPEKIKIFDARWADVENREARVVAAISPDSMLIEDHHRYDLKSPSKFMVCDLDGAILLEFDRPGVSYWEAVSPDGRTLIGEDPDGYWRADLQTGETTTFDLEDDTDFGGMLAFCGNNILLQACNEPSIQTGPEVVLDAYDLSTGKRIWTTQFGTTRFQALAAFSDGRKCIVVTETTASIFDAANGTLLYQHNLPVFARCVAVSPDGRQYAVGGGEARSAGASGGPIYSPDKREYAVVCIAAQPDYREEGRLEGHTAAVFQLAYLTDGQMVSSGDDKTLRIWDVKNGKTIWQAEGLGLDFPQDYSGIPFTVYPNHWLAIESRLPSNIFVRKLPQ